MEAADCVRVRDFEAIANKRLTSKVLCHYNSGATNEQTLLDNCEAFSRWRFQPRVLRDVSNIDTSTSILGCKLPFPICVAPTSLNKMASPDGEIDSARAAARFGTGFALSSCATTSIEDVANYAPSVIRWFQLYVFKDRAFTRRLVKRAEKNGFRAIIATVDIPLLGRRYRDVRSKFIPPSRLSLKNFEDDSQIRDYFSKWTKSSGNSGLAAYVESLIDPSLTWEDIDWLKSTTDLPIIVKGIVTADMAKEAVKHGVDGILVSNHGGRQLDGVLATIDALPQVVKAVSGRCEVYLDGGVRCGGDVAKAIALGAKAVFVGRPMLWGIACDGEAGARKVLEILRNEFELTMKLLGVRSIAELQSMPDLVVHETKMFSKL